MKLSGRITIWADRPRVWAALHDVDILSACIPGCRALKRSSPDRFELGVRAAVGPISALLDGQVEIAESNPPHALCLRARGWGAPVTKVAGSVRIALSQCAFGCRATFEAEIEPDGLFAALSAQLLAGMAQRQIDQFARTFAVTVGTPPTTRPVRDHISRASPPI